MIPLESWRSFHGLSPKPVRYCLCCHVEIKAGWFYCAGCRKRARAAFKDKPHAGYGQAIRTRKL